MRTREDIEKLENEVLAAYAMKSAESGGREYDDSQHPYRTCYQRDRDRIVHSEAFRKLEYRTQVFVILEGDYFRTRLTHTIEVAQIARTIGRCLQLNEDLIEAIALAHDLGHPPFGHAGEEALHKIMEKAGGRFNHNFNSYLIVTKYEKRYPNFVGLDLSREVLVGILKHETVYDISEEVEKYRDDGPTLEAKVVDIADALAYLSHDIDDGITSGCITKNDLMDSELWRRSYGKIEKDLDPNNQEMLKYQVVKYLINQQTKDLLEFSAKNLKEKKFSSSQEARDYLAGDAEPLVDFSPTMKKERQELQDILHEKLYRHFRVQRMTEKAKRILRQIYEVYDANPNQLPYENQPGDKADEHEKSEAICHYIARMTDRSALDEHKKLFDPYKKV